MFKLKAFPQYRQLDQTDCGPACLKIIAAHYGKFLDLNYLRTISHKTSEGTSFANLSKAGNKIGINLIGVRATISQLIRDVSLPAILHWKQNHFVVVYEINKKYVKISDPQLGLIKYSISEFKEKWFPENDLLILIAEPDSTFSQSDYHSTSNNYKFLLNHLS
jgi:ATP-binding cassette subfamily B protein